MDFGSQELESSCRKQIIMWRGYNEINKISLRYQIRDSTGYQQGWTKTQTTGTWPSDEF